jgi:hypothetical protein
MRKNVFRDISPTGTLISKILLGTYACVPAFDRYFVLGLKEAGMTQSDFTLESLKELFEFIDRNIKELVESQKYINSYVKKDNYPGYPIMKIVDMYFWQIGFDVGS